MSLGRTVRAGPRAWALLPHPRGGPDGLTGQARPKLFSHLGRKPGGGRSLSLFVASLFLSVCVTQINK